MRTAPTPPGTPPFTLRQTRLTTLPTTILMPTKTLRPAPATLPVAYARPTVQRFGTFREMTRQGFSGNVDGGLILGPDGSTTPGGDDMVPSGSR